MTISQPARALYEHIARICNDPVASRGIPELIQSAMDVAVLEHWRAEHIPETSKPCGCYFKGGSERHCDFHATE